MKRFSPVVARLTEVFEGHRDASRAAAMAAYMRNQFPFLGIPTPERRRLQREVLSGLGMPDEQELAAVLTELWQCDGREYQYAAADIAARYVWVCTPASLKLIRRLIIEKSWWDTVDALASHTVGPLVAAHPKLVRAMDVWVDDEDLWLRRTAILHQLGYKSATDPDRLFRYCLRRAHERDFFIRKAIGWALREYSKTDATAVTGFVTAHEMELSPLSRREALLWITGRKRKAQD